MTLVIGVDPHKQTHTAVAVRSVSGELVDELSVAARAAGYGHLLTWARAINGERVWALEDVRGVSRGLERFLLERGEHVVRVPPKLMAQARKTRAPTASPTASTRSRSHAPRSPTPVCRSPHRTNGRAICSCS